MTVDILLIIYFFLVYTMFIVVRLFRSSKDSNLKLMSIKDALYESYNTLEVSENEATIMRHNCTVEYHRLQANINITEKLTIAIHDKNKSREIILIYQDGDLTTVKVNNKIIPKDISPDNYIAAHKILELLQTAWTSLSPPLKCPE